MVSCPKTPVPACVQVNIAPSEATQFIKRTHDFFSTVVPRLGSYPLISLSFLSLFVDRHPFATLDFLIIPKKTGKFLKWCLDILSRWRFKSISTSESTGVSHKSFIIDFSLVFASFPNVPFNSTLDGTESSSYS